MYDLFSIRDTKMPDGFLWGSGYAGHQVEGNNSNSNRLLEEIREHYEPSGMACNSYAMYQTDIALAKQLGHQAFRTSVEWCRIQPDPDSFSQEATEHYIHLFAELKEAGIKTFCTLVHMSVPAWFENCGGFTKRENLHYFERFLEYIVPKLAPYVDFWNILNEFNLHPNTALKMNSVLFHALGYHVVKKYSKAPVSSAHAFVQYMPFRPNDPMDKALAAYMDAKDHEFFFNAMKTGEIAQPFCDAIYAPEVRGTVDFWSINIYTRTLVDSRKQSISSGRYTHKLLKMIPMDFYLEEFYPECIIANLTRLTDRPIYITENGCCCDDDRFRIAYLILHLSALRQAMDMGADVRGYLHWTLLDNYEWSSYLPRFGLCSVNRETFERTPKPSAYFYKEIIENNGVNQELIRKYIHEMPSLGL